ncbi:VOC family protein [Corynebacterium gerontici]|uniref:3-demethylubiquinone-9 3-methyltransferase n=1 Tax=Corynebacterium gerontici TaxID=2079234 RepID=A0A3G6J2B3_9CORY|nr:VOC family protein [Corynebacterium gerontici]AZA12201.1 3-demethylubiquinone-9 3-methyltransferase [Corynebacterium gerontici]
MPLASYDFNEHYSWVQDKFGVSWQLLTHTEPTGLPAIYPSLMFCGQAQNRAAEAIDRYTKLFDGRVNQKVTYGEIGQGANGVIEPDSVVFATFELFGETIGAMDSAVKQPFSFDGGVALLVNAHGQGEIDRYFDGLSAVPEAERCGWLRDEFGVSWEIVPDNMGELMTKPNAYEKLMGMGKIIIEEF